MRTFRFSWDISGGLRKAVEEVKPGLSLERGVKLVRGTGGNSPGRGLPGELPRGGLDVSFSFFLSL